MENAKRWKRRIRPRQTASGILSADHVRPQRRSIPQTFSMPTICLLASPLPAACNLCAHARSYRALIREREKQLQSNARLRRHAGANTTNYPARHVLAFWFAKETRFVEHTIGSISVDHNIQEWKFTWRFIFGITYKVTHYFLCDMW